MEHKLNDKFNPKDFEEKLYEKWEKEGYFKPSEDKTKEPIEYSLSEISYIFKDEINGFNNYDVLIDNGEKLRSNFVW